MAHKRAQDMWRVRFQAPPEAIEAFETALDPLVDAFLCFEIDGSPEPKAVAASISNGYEPWGGRSLTCEPWT